MLSDLYLENIPLFIFMGSCRCPKIHTSHVRVLRIHDEAKREKMEDLFAWAASFGSFDRYDADPIVQSRFVFARL